MQDGRSLEKGRSPNCSSWNTRRDHDVILARLGRNLQVNSVSWLKKQNVMETQTRESPGEGLMSVLMMSESLSA